MIKSCFLITLSLFATFFPAGVHTFNDRRPPVWTPSAGSPTRITATLPGWNVHKTPTGNYTFPDTATIHQALKYGENLESLSLRVALLGCSEWPDRWSLPFDLAGGDKYQPLKHLCLEEYQFGDSEFQSVSPPEGLPVWDSYAYQWQNWITSGRALKWWRWRQLAAHQHSKTNAELWADAMDWSQLEQLELRDLNGALFIKHISPKLTGLKEVVLDHFRPWNATHKWLVSLSPLRKLAWLGGYDTEDTILESILQRHGPTLETLELHPKTMTTEGGPFVSASQIETIGTMAPKLKHLAIAIQRNGTWPFEAFEAISQIPSLHTAEIWMQYISAEGLKFDDGNFYGDRYEIFQKSKDDSPLYQKPLLNKQNVTQLWNFMKDKARDSNSSLQSVSFRAGDFSRSWDGPIHFEDWYEGQRVSWFCSDDVVEKEGENSDGGVGRGGCRETDRESDDFEIYNEGYDYENDYDDDIK